MVKCSIVSTSYASSEREVRKMIRNVVRLGFDKVSVYSSKRIFFNKWAGAPKKRLKMFYDAWGSDSDVIIASRGGSGISQFISELDVSFLREKKLVVGYSDFTMLLNFLNQKLGIVALHGPMALKSLDGESLFYLKRALGMNDYSVPFLKRMSYGSNLLSMSGEIVAGNLSRLVESLLFYDIDFEDKILFLEEVGMSEHKIINLLYALSAYEGFSPKAIVFGNMGYTFSKEFKSILKNIFFSVPLLFGFPFGHQLPNITIPIGASCTIDFNKCSFDFSFPDSEKGYAVKFSNIL